MLIVEDEAVTVLALQDELPDYGFDVAGVAMSADEAVRVVSQDKPDIALVDLRLKPDADGEVLTGIRLAEELWVCDQVPVVFITASTDRSTQQLLEPAGAFGFVAKPFTVGAVAACLRVALAKYHEYQAERGRHS